MEEDIKNSNYVLYRGSSVVIQAVLSGLKPIYFMEDNELSMDPLFLCQESERIVSNSEDFCEKIKDKKKVSRKLEAHCRDMYTNIDISSLEKLK